MARAKTIGSGWHGQSLRHKNAKLHGRAGGIYSSLTVGTRVEQKEHKFGLTTSRKIANDHLKEDPSYYNKDMTYNQLKQRGINLKPNADTDKDGVRNKDDCRPLNPKAQDNGEPKQENITISTTEPTPEKKSWIQKIKEYNAKKEVERKEKAEQKEKKEIEELEKEREQLLRLKEKEKIEREKKDYIQKLREENDELSGRAESRRKRKEFFNKAGKLIAKEVKDSLKTYGGSKKKHHRKSTHTKKKHHHKKKETGLFA